MASSFQTIDEQPLLAKDDIRRRLNSYVNPKAYGRRTVMGVPDISQWCGCSVTLLRHYMTKKFPVSDKMQLRLSQFFTLLDSGRIRFTIDGRHRHFVRGDPLKPVRLPPVGPRVDFTGASPKVRFG